MKLKFAFTLTFNLLAIIAFNQDKNLNKIIDQYFLFLNKHDTVAVSKLYADDATLRSPNWEGNKKGQAGAREIFSRYFISSPDLKYTITHTVFTGNTAIVEYTSDGTIIHTEDDDAKYMNGRHYVLNNITRFEIKENKIVESVSYFDQVAFLRQVGFFEQRH
ncbi:MAG TPA: nuclear transport factor 2 family protein [Chitinophagaceae bacterium]|nr:nuclear transport factor 2 family protein [Chitinophagaceae bacterium]